MGKLYEVIVATFPNGDNNPPVYSRLYYKGRIEWKTKRIAEKHARDYKARHLMDAWVQEV